MKAGLPLERFSQGRIHFWAHSHHCWQAPIPHYRPDPPVSHYETSLHTLPKCPHGVASGSPQSEGSNRGRAQHGSHSLITSPWKWDKTTCAGGWQSQRPALVQCRRRSTQGRRRQKAGIVGNNLQGLATTASLPPGDFPGYCQEGCTFHINTSEHSLTTCVLGLREYPHKQKNNSISSIVHPSRVLSFPIILHYCLICTDDDLKSPVVSPCLFSFMLVFLLLRDYKTLDSENWFFMITILILSLEQCLQYSR